MKFVNSSYRSIQCDKERTLSLRRIYFQSEYGGVEDVRMRRQLIWTPDILLFESSSASFDPTYPSNIVVSRDGGCSFVPPGIFKSTCSIDMTWNEQATSPPPLPRRPSAKQFLCSYLDRPLKHQAPKRERHTDKASN